MDVLPRVYARPLRFLPRHRGAKCACFTCLRLGALAAFLVVLVCLFMLSKASAIAGFFRFGERRGKWLLDSAIVDSISARHSSGWLARDTAGVHGTAAVSATQAHALSLLDVGQERRVLVSNTTKLSGAEILTRSFSRRIIVSEVSKLIYCPIPKAASSNWKYLIRKIEGLADYHDLTKAHLPELSGLRYLSDYSSQEVETLLRDPSYFKFAFVRDPYTRLLSCYMDKFQNRDPIYVKAEYRNFLAQLYDWRYARSVDIENEPRPSFVEFVDELAKQDPVIMNEHWAPQAMLCGFGQMPYDFVGKMENLAPDVDSVLKRLGWTQEHFPTHEEICFKPSGASNSDAMSHYTLDTMLKVRVIYDVDFNSLFEL